MRKTSAAAEWQRSRTAPRPPSTFSEKEALGRVASGENSGAQHTLDQTIAILSMHAQAVHAVFQTAQDAWPCLPPLAILLQSTSDCPATAAPLQARSVRSRVCF